MIRKDSCARDCLNLQQNVNKKSKRLFKKNETVEGVTADITFREISKLE